MENLLVGTECATDDGISVFLAVLGFALNFGNRRHFVFGLGVVRSGRSIPCLAISITSAPAFPLVYKLIHGQLVHGRQAVPSVGVFDLPYIFTTKEKAYEVLDGEIGREIFAKAEQQEGYYVLAVFEGGFRQSINNKLDIDCMDGYKGLKFRTPESSVYLGLYEHLGAIPTAMDMSEVFTALENGRLDGSESPLFTIYLEQLV